MSRKPLTLRKQMKIMKSILDIQNERLGFVVDRLVRITGNLESINLVLAEMFGPRPITRKAYLDVRRRNAKALKAARGRL